MFEEINNGGAGAMLYDMLALDLEGWHPRENVPQTKATTSEELAGFLKEMGCTHKSNGKNWGWIFPPLSEAREAWRARAGGDWEWLTPGIADWGEKPANES